MKEFKRKTTVGKNEVSSLIELFSMLEIARVTKSESLLS